MDRVPPTEAPAPTPWTSVRHRGACLLERGECPLLVRPERAAGDDRFYLTMPPGSGKTLVGLEIVRRLARPTLVLSPNTAIQAQWTQEWAASFDSASVRAATTPDLDAPITCLLYTS